MSHAVHAKTTTETKARLDKKHVEVLEAEFQKNQKPSSIVKRELAEQMGHEVARINVRVITLDPLGMSVLTRLAELVPEPASKGEVEQEDGRIRSKGVKSTA
jgi:hypothetical protein